MSFERILRRVDNPDFVPSLRLLIESERYSHVDVGLMWGVSRERVRQWCSKFEIVHPDNNHQRGSFAYRVWDDKLNRFVPVSRRLHTEKIRSKQRIVRKQALESRRRGRRVLIVATAVELQDVLGRAPTLPEIAIAVRGYPGPHGSAGAYLVGLWDSSSRKSTRVRYQELRTVLNAVGVKARGMGSPGHIDPNKPRNLKTHCKRNHLLLETRNKWGNCVLCKKVTENAKRARRKNKTI